MAKSPGLSYEKTLDQERQAIICRPAGKLVGCTATYEFLEDIRDEVRGGLRNVVMDLSGVTRINSTGIGVLAALYTSTANRQGKLILVGVSSNTQRILEVVYLWTVVEKADRVEDALASL